MTDFRQQFDHVDRLRLEVGQPAPTAPNYIRNPDGVLGGWGWVTPIAATGIEGFGPGVIAAFPNGTLRFTTPTTLAAADVAYFYSESIPVTAGQYVGSRGYSEVISTGTTMQALIEFFDASGAFISSTGSGITAGPINWTNYGRLVPAGAVTARWRMNLFRSTAGARNIYFNRITMTTGPDAASTTGFAFNLPVHTWVDVIGPTHEIDVDRETLDVGTLTATILDATLDPAQASTIRPGRPCRLRALADNAWQEIFTGEVTHAKVDYGSVKAGLVRPVVNRAVNPRGTASVPSLPGSFSDARYTSLCTYTYGGSGGSTPPGFPAPFTFARLRNDADTGGNIGWHIAGNPENVVPQESESFSVTPGETVYIGHWVRAANNPTAVDWRLIGKWHNGVSAIAGPSLATNTVNLGGASGNTWKWLDAEVVVPAGATYLAVASLSATKPPVGQNYDATGLVVTRSTSGEIVPTGPSSFFDGRTAGAAWDGPPEASTSTRLWDGNPKRVKVELTAVDALARLDSTSRPLGVGTLNELIASLEGAGVPWKVNNKTGSTEKTAPTIVSSEDNSSLLDQIALTRDSREGLAYIDKRGVLVIADGAFDPVAQNSGFETTITPWAAFDNCTIVRVSAAGGHPTRNGSVGAMRMQATAAGNMNALTPYGTAGIPVTPVTPYKVTANFRAYSVSRSCRVGIDYYNSNGGLVGSFTGAPVVDTASNYDAQATLAYTSPPEAAFASIVVRVDGCNAGELHYVDDVVFGGPTLTEDDYSDITASYATDDVMNEVTVQRLVLGGDPEFYGPYVDQASINEWGRHAQTFTVHGVAASAIPALAGRLLARNKAPVLRAETLTLPVLADYHIATRAMLDVTNAVTVQYRAIGLLSPVRIAAVRHRITTDGWLVDLTFTRPDASAIPRTRR